MFLSVHSPSLLTKFAEQVTQGDGDGVKGTRKSINTCSTSHMRHVTQQLQPETSPIKTNQLHTVSPRDLSVVRVRGVRDRTEFAGGGGILAACVCGRSNLLSLVFDPSFPQPSKKSGSPFNNRID